MPDGSVRWQHWSNRAIFGGNGEIIEYQAVGRDITEKKEIEISLIENLNYVKALMHSIPVPVFYRDVRGVYQDCNKAFETMVGKSRAGIIGKSIHELFPEDLADHYRSMDDLIIDRPHIQQYEYVTVNGSGEKIDVLFSKSAFFNADGMVKGIVGVIVDISERKIFEQIIQKSEEKYRTIAEFTYDWEAWLSPDGRYLYVSPSCEDITGYSRSDFVTDPGLVVAITHPEDRQYLEEHYGNLKEKRQEIFQMDYRIITRSGEERWINHFCQSVFRDDGTWLGRRESRRDITERKQIEKAHEQANLKLNLLSNITRHDILNQLAGLIGYADMALESSREPEIRGMLNRILTAANTITEQISFTRVYQDIGLHAPVWHHVPAVIRRTCSGIGLKISVTPDLDTIEINADPLIEKVFFCLLDNSERHGVGVSSARFSGRYEGKNLIIEYTDDGGGIAEQDKKRIFERGFGKNTGYGLFLAREILAFSGGSIRETGRYGEGVRFEIGFPEGSYRCLAEKPG
jgi:PAS domain S-box-containing protein